MNAITIIKEVTTLTAMLGALYLWTLVGYAALG